MDKIIDTFDYEKAYNSIACVVGELYPTCEVTTVDMVVLLAHEVDTLRIALGIPTRKAVIVKLEAEEDLYDKL